MQPLYEYLVSMLSSSWDKIISIRTVIRSCYHDSFIGNELCKKSTIFHEMGVDMLWSSLGWIGNHMKINCLLPLSSPNLQFLFSGFTERISEEAEWYVGSIFTIYSFPATRSTGLLRTLKYLNHSFVFSVAVPCIHGWSGDMALDDLLKT